MDEYRNGALPQKSVAILSYETAKLGSGRVPAMSTRKLRLRWKEKGEWQMQVINACTCPHCGKFVAGDYDEEGNAVTGEIITPATAAQFVGAKTAVGCSATALPIAHAQVDLEPGNGPVRTA